MIMIIIVVVVIIVMIMIIIIVVIMIMISMVIIITIIMIIIITIIIVNMINHFKYLFVQVIRVLWFARELSTSIFSLSSPRRFLSSNSVQSALYGLASPCKRCLNLNSAQLRLNKMGKKSTTRISLWLCEKLMDQNLLSHSLSFFTPSFPSVCLSVYPLPPSWLLSLLYPFLLLLLLLLLLPAIDPCNTKFVV